MKSLIRFEDTYGLTDIFCARCGLPWIDISRIADTMIEINEDLFIDFGLGGSWGKISYDEAYTILERGIERIILVYDMDNLSGNKKDILTEQELTNKLSNIEEVFRNVGYTVEICCIPVVYAAETLMLYQFLDESFGISIQNLVNAVNTNWMHLCLIAYLVGEVNVKRGKNVRNYIDIKKLIEAFEKRHKKDINNFVKQWIIDGCNTDSKYIFSQHDAIDHLRKTKIIFDKYMKLSNRHIQIDNHVIDLSRKTEPLLAKK